MDSEEDILAGIMRVRIGGVEKALPTLKLRKARAWKEQVGEVLGTSLDGFELNGSADLAGLALVAGDRMLDLVLAYDETGALGGREWLEDNADDAQVYAILRTLLDRSFPFVRDLNAVVARLREALAGTALVPAASLGARSTNGLSPTGDSAPTTSGIG